MIHCAMCDAGLYRDRVVAVCGGGNAGLIEAMFLARFASRVYVVEPQGTLAAAPALQAQAAETRNLEIRLGFKPVEIRGEDGVSALDVENVRTGARESIDVYGVLVRVGFTPASVAWADRATATTKTPVARGLQPRALMIEVTPAPTTQFRDVRAAGAITWTQRRRAPT